MSLRCRAKAHPSTYDFTGLQTDILSQFGLKINTQELAQLDRTDIEETIYEQLAAKYQQKEDLVGSEVLRATERMIMLNVIDNQWKDHLLSMDHLKEGIGLRGYGQKDPLVEYKKESFVLFEEMWDRIEDETERYLFFLQAVREEVPFGSTARATPVLPFPTEEEEEVEEEEQEPVAVISREQQLAAQSSLLDFTRNIQRKKEKELAELQFVGGDASSSSKKTVVKGAKVGRNDPCPCGSGRKYKKCCGG
jgi:preprotein translocase subunit SecA